MAKYAKIVPKQLFGAYFYLYGAYLKCGESPKRGGEFTPYSIQKFAILEAQHELRRPYYRRIAHAKFALYLAKFRVNPEPSSNPQRVHVPR